MYNSYFRNILTYLLTYLLTPRSRVLLEKLTSFQLVKEFLAFHGTRRFITAVTSVRHLSLSWASWIQSMPLHRTSWKSIWILNSHLRLGLLSGLLPSGFPTKTLYKPVPSPHTRYMPRPSHSRFYHPNNIGWGVQIVKLIIQFFSTPCHLVPLMRKYSPQPPILKYPQPTFAPQCDRPSCTPIQNSRENYSSYNSY